MANLVQVAEELEYVPKEQLIQMSQSPDSRYPQYLVLSEIQRRTQMEKMYNAQEAAMNQPQMTVADEVVSEYAQPQQGLAGMNAGGSGNTDVFSPPAMPASPMQQMASGGRTGYQNTGRTTYSTYSGPNARKQLLASFNVDTTGMSDQEIAQALQLLTLQQKIQSAGATTGPNFNAKVSAAAPQSPISTGVNQPVDLQTVIPSTPLDNTTSPTVSSSVPSIGAGLGGASRTSVDMPDIDMPEVDQSGTVEVADIPEEDRKNLVDWALENPGEAAIVGLNAVALGLLVSPVPGARIGAAFAKGASLVGRGIQGLRGAYQARKANQIMKAGRRQLEKTGNIPGVSGKPGQIGSGPTRPYNPEIVYAAGKPIVRQMAIQRGIAGPFMGISGYMAYNYMTDDEIAESDEKEQDVVKTTQDKLNELLADINKRQDTGTAEKKGLASFLPQADGLDIAQLGGIIMGARNMSELGAGIAGLAGSIQDRRMKDKLSGIQGDLYKAQTDKYRADIANMEPQQLVEIMKNLEDMMKLDMESGQGENVAQYQAQYEAAYKRYAELMGIPYTTEAERMQEALNKAAAN